MKGKEYSEAAQHSASAMCQIVAMYKPVEGDEEGYMDMMREMNMEYAKVHFSYREETFVLFAYSLLPHYPDFDMGLFAH